MKDIYDVIRQKEADLERIQHEIEALRLSAKLLEDSVRTSASATVPLYSTTPKPSSAQPVSAPAAWATAKQFP
jgi:hypothetical protein